MPTTVRAEFAQVLTRAHLMTRLLVRAIPDFPANVSAMPRLKHDARHGQLALEPPADAVVDALRLAP